MVFVEEVDLTARSYQIGDVLQDSYHGHIHKFQTVFHNIKKT